MKYFICVLMCFCGFWANVSLAALQIDVGPVSNATRTTAISYATLTSTNGSSNTVSVVLYYGTSDGSSNTANWAASNVIASVTSATPTVITNALSGLAPASQYYCRWYAIEGTNSDWSAGTNFTTLAGVPTNTPTVPLYTPVMQDSNGVVRSPSDFASANGLSTTNADAVLQAQISSNDTDISSLQLQVSSNDTDISSLQLQVSSNDTDIGSLQLQVSSNDTDIIDLNSNLTAHAEANAIAFQDTTNKYTAAVSNWWTHPAKGEITFQTVGIIQLSSSTNGMIGICAGNSQQRGDNAPLLLMTTTNYSSSPAEGGCIWLTAGGYNGTSGPEQRQSGRIYFDVDGVWDSNVSAYADTNQNWSFEGHYIYNAYVTVPAETNSPANKMYVDGKFSAGKSTTNSWVDANTITNIQIFINGLLTSWTTNGVEL